jgi:hypothetical protein
MCLFIADDWSSFRSVPVHVVCRVYDFVARAATDTSGCQAQSGCFVVGRLFNEAFICATKWINLIDVSRGCVPSYVTVFV